MCVRVLKVDDKRNCVEFIKLSGNNVNFHDHFKEIKLNVLNFANDEVNDVRANGGR